MSAKATILLAAFAMCLTACSGTVTTWQSAQDAVQAMGGEEKLSNVKMLVMRGSGTRVMFGQARTRGEQDPVAKITNLVEVVDITNGRAAFEYDFEMGPFKQHRREVLAKKGEGGAARSIGIQAVGDQMVAMSFPALYGYATHHSPEMLLGRNAVTMALTLSTTAAEGQTARETEFNGKMLRHGTARAKTGEEMKVYFHPESRLLEGFELTETDPVMGATPTQYMFEDYKAVDGIMLPHRVKIRKKGVDFADIQYSSAAFSDPAAEALLAVPEQVAQEADAAIRAGDYVPLKLNRIAAGVYHAQGASHHSLVVEFPRWVAVVEAPQSAMQTKVLEKLIQAQIPRKPIRYAIPTHPHHDHIGGLRQMAALEATIVVAKGHETDFKEILEARHSRPQDDLESRRYSRPPKKVGSMEVFEDKKVIRDGNQTLELYVLTGSPHIEPVVIAYVPSARVVFQSDLYSPGSNAGSPAATHLAESIRKLGLRVDRIAGGHGSIGPLAELAKATASN